MKKIFFFIAVILGISVMAQTKKVIYLEDSNHFLVRQWEEGNRISKDLSIISTRRGNIMSVSAVTYEEKTFTEQIIKLPIELWGKLNAKQLTSLGSGKIIKLADNSRRDNYVSLYSHFYFNFYKYDADTNILINGKKDLSLLFSVVIGLIFLSGFSLLIKIDFIPKSLISVSLGLVFGFFMISSSVVLSQMLFLDIWFTLPNLVIFLSVLFVVNKIRGKRNKSIHT